MSVTSRQGKSEPGLHKAPSREDPVPSATRNVFLPTEHGELAGREVPYIINANTDPELFQMGLSGGLFTSQGLPELSYVLVHPGEEWAALVVPRDQGHNLIQEKINYLQFLTHLPLRHLSDYALAPWLLVGGDKVAHEVASRQHWSRKSLLQQIHELESEHDAVATNLRTEQNRSGLLSLELQETKLALAEALENQKELQAELADKQLALQHQLENIAAFEGANRVSEVDINTVELSSQAAHEDAGSLLPVDTGNSAATAQEPATLDVETSGLSAALVDPSLVDEVGEWEGDDDESETDQKLAATEAQFEEVSGGAIEVLGTEDAADDQIAPQDSEDSTHSRTPPSEPGHDEPSQITSDLHAGPEAQQGAIPGQQDTKSADEVPTELPNVDEQNPVACFMIGGRASLALHRSGFADGESITLVPRLHVAEHTPVFELLLIGASGKQMSVFLNPRSFRDRGFIEGLRKNLPPAAWKQALETGPNDIARVNLQCAPLEANIARMMERLSRLPDPALGFEAARDRLLEHREPFESAHVMKFTAIATADHISLEDARFIEQATHPDREVQLTQVQGVPENLLLKALRRVVEASSNQGLILEVGVLRKAFKYGFISETTPWLVETLKKRGDDPAPFSPEEVVRILEISQEFDLDVPPNLAERLGSVNDLKGALEPIALLRLPQTREPAARALLESELDERAMSAVIRAVGHMTEGEMTAIMPSLLAAADEVLDPLIEALSHPKPEMRALAIVVLEKRKVRRAVTPLVQLLMTEPSPEWQEIADCLSAFGTVSIRAVLRHLETQFGLSRGTLDEIERASMLISLIQAKDPAVTLDLSMLPSKAQGQLQSMIAQPKTMEPLGGRIHTLRASLVPRTP